MSISEIEDIIDHGTREQWQALSDADFAEIRKLARIGWMAKYELDMEGAVNQLNELMRLCNEGAA